MTLIAERAKLELEHLIRAGIPSEIAETAIDRQVIDWEAQAARAEKKWITVLRERMAELVIELYGAGLEREISIQVAPQEKPYDIKRGEGKGEKRAWRFSQNSGREPRSRLTPGQRLAILFNEEKNK